MTSQSVQKPEGPLLTWLAAITLLLCGCASGSPPGPQDGWKTVDLRAFSISLPSDVVYIPVQGIDSYCGSFRSETLRLHFDYGWYSNSLDKEEMSPSAILLDHQEDWTLIDGHRAKMVHAKGLSRKTSEPYYFSAVYFPEVDAPSSQSKGESVDRLNFSIASDRPMDQEFAEKILRSICFPPVKASLKGLDLDQEPKSPKTPPSALEAFAKVAKFSDDNIQELAKAYKEATGYDLDLRFSFLNLEPQWLRKFKAGPIRWMLLLEYHGSFHSQHVSFVQVHLFDADWHRVAKQLFPTGRDLFLGKADIEHSSVFDQDVLVLNVREYKQGLSALGSQGRENQVYALRSDKLDLVRVADQEGKLRRKDFQSWFPDKGTAQPKRTVEEWLASLQKKDPAEQLAALVWLTGVHLPSSQTRSGDPEQESLEASLMFERVRDSDRTAVILNELKQSTHRWVRDYAELGVLKNQ